jgi:hypothetical protein
MLLLIACSAGPGSESQTPLVEQVDDGVTLSDVQACSAPSPTTTYTEAGEAWGFQAPDNVSPRHEESASLVAGDIDGDGWDDLVNVNRDGTSYYYRNTGTSFEVTDLTSVIIPMISNVLFDIDTDGDLDLVAGGNMPTTLRNEGGVFRRNEPLPLLPSTQNGAAVLIHDLSPADIDGDGVVEFYLALTYNFGDEATQYTDPVMKWAGADYTYDESIVPTDVGYRQSLDVVLFDVDGDLDEDAYVANDFGILYGGSTLLVNQGGTFTSAEDTCFCSLLKNAKGVDIDDFNSDGRPDILVSGNPSNTLLVQLDDGSFVDETTIANAAAIDEDATGWGGIFLDFDNDGQRDLFPAQGDRWNEGNDHPHFDTPLKLLRQEQGVFSDVSAAMGIAAMGSFRAVSALDFNHDGVEDLVATQMDDRPMFYVSDGCTEAGWVEVEAPIGSKVVIEAGGRTQTNWIRTDAGYQSHRPPRVHFGLGEAKTIDRLTVTRLDGTELGATWIEAQRRITIGG